MRAWLALVACLLAAPAAAQQVRSFTLPAGCEAYLTVQSKGCLVSHHFTCEGDLEGWQRRVDMNLDGPTYLAMTDAETQWMESLDLSSGIVDRLEDEPRDPASFSVLIGEGTDTFDFRTLSDQVGERRFVGFDTLTGQTREIDGITLEETEYRITAYDAAGEVAWASRGQQWITRDYRIFLSGVSLLSSSGRDFEIDNSPVDFIFPGEPGFLAASPIHGCNETVAALPGVAVIPAALETGR